MADYNFALASLGAVATANNNENGYPPVQAIDGSAQTQWRETTGYTYGALVIDLQVAQTIYRVHTKSVALFGATGNWLLQYGADGVNWNNTELLFPNNAESNQSFDAITARYWRLYYAHPTNQRYAINYVELVGEVPAPPPPGGPADPYLADWLDGLQANYVPDAQDWLDAN